MKNFNTEKYYDSIHYDHYTPLISAVLSQDVKSVNGILQSGTDPNFKVVGGRIALSFAVRLQNFEIVKLLIDYDSDLQNKDNKGNTIGHMAVLYPLTTGRIKYLYDAGVPFNVKNMAGELPLHVAIRCGYLGVVKCLVEKQNINVDERDIENGTTIIEVAQMSGHMPVLLYLMNKSVLINSDKKAIQDVLLHIDDHNDVETTVAGIEESSGCCHIL